MASLKIKVGDTVRVIAGKEKGNEGKVIAVNAKNNTVIVEGLNMIVKHEKPSMANQAGGRIEQEGPINLSNVMLLVDGKPSRVGFERVDDKNGKKKSVRVAKSTGKKID